MEKEIKVVTLKVSDLKHGFGNPRKITKAKEQELRKSLEESGDFGCFVIDENYNLIGGNQRASILMRIDPDTPVLCKMLIGYSESELRAINIKDNTHAGEWDLDLLADWTADLNLDMGTGLLKERVKGHDATIEKMELIPYEKYDYVIIACKDEQSYEELTETLGIKGKEVRIGDKSRATIQARAIWYDKVRDIFVRARGQEE